MNPISGLFGVGVAVRNALYDSGRFEAKRLEGPVVSIGNLSVGGTGKTPFTQTLGDFLVERGMTFDILSRGYGRSTTDVKVVDPNGGSREFGDEPLLLAKHFAAKWPGDALKAPKVVVGANRFEAGRLAEKQFGPRLHLLDDGFQHRKLARDFDIVLLAPDDATQGLLPVGRLREPLRSLQRADAVVATEGVELQKFPLLPPRVWRVERDIVLPPGLARGARPVAFCGIARPERFMADLRRHGVSPVAEITFRDHHAYTARDVERIRREFSSSGADCYLTTIKDMMNLGELAQRLSPVHPVRLEMKFEAGQTAIDDMLRVIAERRAKL